MFASLQRLWSKPRRPSPTAFGTALDLDSAQKLSALLLQIRSEYDFKNFALDSFRDWVAQKRQRPIEIYPYNFTPGIYGVWVSIGNTDLIFYDQKTCQLHQIHIQLHELAHMFCGHQTLDLSHVSNFSYSTFTSWLEGSCQLPNTTGTDLSKMLLRAKQGRKTHDEVEAELLSELIMNEVFDAQVAIEMTMPPTHTKNPILREVFQDMRWL